MSRLKATWRPRTTGKDVELQANPASPHLVVVVLKSQSGLPHLAEIVKQGSELQLHFAGKKVVLPFGHVRKWEPGGTRAES